MNIETLKELQKGITQGKWRVSPSGILICTADQEQPHVNICLIEDGNDALAPLPNEVWSNAKAIGLVPELIEEVIKLRGLVKHVIECADDPDNYEDPKDFVWSLDFEGLRAALK